MNQLANGQLILINNIYMAEDISKFYWYLFCLEEKG